MDPPVSISFLPPTIQPAAIGDTMKLVPEASSAGNFAPPGYEILGELGRGGMGVVYKARQMALKRVVALKMILAGGHAGAEELARFRSEAEALARLHHANIVQVYEVGEHSGLPYLSLEFCGGGALSRWLAGTPLPARSAARLVEVLARAMEAAHACSVIHRDLKPANVLLQDPAHGRRDPQTDFPQPPDTGASRAEVTFIPKITDFGLAKLMDAAAVTVSGEVMGTPSYMAPEQAAGQVKAVGPPVDIYALGAILYECLTGRPPFKAATVMETLLLVREQEPVPPTRLQPRLPRDLETVCLKCLHKEPAKRYPSAGELADDLKRFLDGEPIRARTAGVLERALKWTRRRPLVTSLLATIALVVVGGVTGVTVALNLALYQRTQAEVARDKETTQRSRAEQQRAEAEANLDEAQHNLAVNNIQQAFEAFSRHNAAEGRHRLQQVPAPRRGWEWFHLNQKMAGGIYTLYGTSRIESLAFNPDGTRLLMASLDGNAQWRDVRTGQRLATSRDDSSLNAVTLSPEGISSSFQAIALSPEGRFLAAIDGGQHREREHVHLFDVAARRFLRSLPGDRARLNDLAFSPDGRLLAAACGEDQPSLGIRQGTVRLWEVANGRLMHVIRGQGRSFHHVAFSPDSRRIAATCADKTVRVWEVATGKPLCICQGADPHRRDVVFSPDGKLLAARDNDFIQFWDAATGRPLERARTSALVTSLAFSPDGQLLAFGSMTGVIDVWDLLAGQQAMHLAGHTNRVKHLAFSPDGQFLASGGIDGSVKLWDRRARASSIVLRAKGQWLNQVVWSADSRAVALAGQNGAVTLWDSWTGQEQQRFSPHQSSALCVAFSPDGRLLASGSEDGAIHVNEMASAVRRLRLSRSGCSITSLSFSPDGTRLATGAYKLDTGEVCIWELPSGHLLHEYQLTNMVNGVAFSPDGRVLAASMSGGTISRWDAITGAKLTAFECPAQSTNGIVFSPDGQLLATGCASVQKGRATILDAVSGNPVRSLHGQKSILLRPAFSPDGLRLYTAGYNDHDFRVWDVRTGQRLISLRMPNTNTSVACSPDGRRLAVACVNTVVFLEGGTGQELLTLAGHEGEVVDVLFSLDGRRLATLAADHKLIVWDTQTGARLLTREKIDPFVPELRFSPDGRHLDIRIAKEHSTWDLNSGERVEMAPAESWGAHKQTSRDGRLWAHRDGDVVHLIDAGPLTEQERERRQFCTAPDPAWHVEEAKRNETAGEWHALTFHLQRQLLAEPWNAGLCWRHAEACARAGQTEHAALSFVRALLLDPRRATR